MLFIYYFQTVQGNTRTLISSIMIWIIFDKNSITAINTLKFLQATIGTRSQIFIQSDTHKGSGTQ